MFDLSRCTIRDADARCAAVSVDSCLKIFRLAFKLFLSRMKRIQFLVEIKVLCPLCLESVFYCSGK